VLAEPNRFKVVPFVVNSVNDFAQPTVRGGNQLIDHLLRKCPPIETKDVQSLSKKIGEQSRVPTAKWVAFQLPGRGHRFGMEHRGPERLPEALGNQINVSERPREAVPFFGIDQVLHVVREGVVCNCAPLPRVEDAATAGGYCAM